MPLLTETTAYLKNKLFQPVAIEYFHKKESNCNVVWNDFFKYNISVTPKEKIKFFPHHAIKLTEISKERNSLLSKTIDIVNLSNHIFLNSKPLDDDALGVLNKTFKRLLKQSPTKL